MKPYITLGNFARPRPSLEKMEREKKEIERRLYEIELKKETERSPDDRRFIELHHKRS